MQGSETLREKLESLRQSYARKLPEKLRAIDLVWEKLQAGSGGASEQWQMLFEKVHSLSGTGASFGYPLLSDKAGELDRLIRKLLNENEIDFDEVGERVGRLLGELHLTVKVQEPLSGFC